MQGSRYVDYDKLIELIDRQRLRPTRPDKSVDWSKGFDAECDFIAGELSVVELPIQPGDTVECIEIEESGPEILSVGSRHVVEAVGRNSLQLELIQGWRPKAAFKRVDAVKLESQSIKLPVGPKVYEAVAAQSRIINGEPAVKYQALDRIQKTALDRPKAFEKGGFVPVGPEVRASIQPNQCAFEVVRDVATTILNMERGESVTLKIHAQPDMDYFDWQSSADQPCGSSDLARKMQEAYEAETRPKPWPVPVAPPAIMPGDTVKCLRVSPHCPQTIKAEQMFQVHGITKAMLSLVGVSGWWPACDFERLGVTKEEQSAEVPKVTGEHAATSYDSASAADSATEQFAVGDMVTANYNAVPFRDGKAYPIMAINGNVAELDVDGMKVTIGLNCLRKAPPKVKVYGLTETGFFTDEQISDGHPFVQQWLEQKFGVKDPAGVVTFHSVDNGAAYSHANDKGFVTNPNTYQAWLLERTHVVEYNPNCPKPFMVRLCGKGRPRIDKLDPKESQDAIGYGRNLMEAVDEAKTKRPEYYNAPVDEPVSQPVTPAESVLPH